ncbi:MAG: CHAT domain-containing protein, partial [Pseudonocardiaceae bacterium]
MTTVYLELEIGRNSGDGYPVLARSGKEVATTRLPVTSIEPDRQLAMLRSTVLTSSTEAGPEADKDQQHMRELGTELFEPLFAGDVRDLYTASLQRAHEQDSTMRLVLRVHPPELARLPWEYLFDPLRRDYLGLRVSLVRYPEMLAPRQPLRTTGPLRVLGMVIGADQDSGQVEQERQRLHEALAGLDRDGLVELGWVDGFTAGDLVAALDRGPWHGFHAVSIEGQQGGDDVSRLLADHHTMRMVVLDARGTGPGTDSEGFAGIAGALLRQGIPAVVAMQFAVTEATSIAFAQPFYLSVAAGLPVDVGVVRARRAVRLASKDTLEWGTPVLYLRAPDGQIFQAAAASDQAEGSTSTPRPDPRYAQALDAFWAQQWDQAIELLQEFLDHYPDHPDAAARLTQARHEQELAGRYAQACAAAEAAEWESAIAGFAVVAEADPVNLEARDRLEQACREQAAQALLEAHQEQSAADSALPAVPRLARHPRAGQILHSGKEVNAVAFSPDGQWLATAGRKNIAQVWDTTNGQEMLSVGSKVWRRSMEAVAFSQDGQWLATAGDDGTARIWDATSGEELLTVTHKAEMWGVAFSPDGRWLATAGDDCTARIWDATSGEELLTVTHDNWVRGVAFSPD